MRFVKPVIGTVVVAVGAYAAAGYFGVPAGIRWAVNKYVPQALGGRSVDIKDISFNPWTWRLDVQGVSVASANNPGSSLLSLEGLSTKVNFATLSHMAPIVDFIDVKGLHVKLTANQKNNSEVSATISGSDSKSSGLPAFSLSNIRVSDSSVQFSNPKAGAKVNISDITFELPVVSTLNVASVGSMTPKLSLKIDGTPVVASGVVKGDAATLALNIKDLDIAKLLKAIPITIPADVRSAHLTTVLNMDFAMPKNGTTSLTVKGTVQAHKLDARMDHGNQAFAAQTVSVNLNRFDLSKKTVEIGNLEVVKPNISVKMASGIGQKNTDAKNVKTTASAKTNSKASAAGGWNWSLAQAEIAGGTVKITDTSLKPASTLNISAVNLKAKGFSSKNGATGTYSASAKLANGAVESSGKLTISPLAVNATTNVKSLGFATFNPWVKAISGAQLVKGSTDIIGKVDYRSGKSVKLAWAGDLAVDNLQAKSAAGKTLMTWKQATANGVNLSSIEPINISIKELAVKEPAQKVTKTTSSVLGILGALASATGHNNTARRMQKAEETIVKDIKLNDVVYQNGRFSVKGKGLDVLETMVLEALNSTFAKKQ